MLIPACSEKSELFLNQKMIGGEKWIIYENTVKETAYCGTTGYVAIGVDRGKTFLDSNLDLSNTMRIINLKRQRNVVDNSSVDWYAEYYIEVEIAVLPNKDMQSCMSQRRWRRSKYTVLLERSWKVLNGSNSGPYTMCIPFNRIIQVYYHMHVVFLQRTAEH
ncbi:hypothetical protein DICVIV_01469 [Dictyocaulus viviparus]|uniref:Uncharacterized protein n=1 Tax=Dictyocaulus viviparus TaxID=29172 RepID=A0A0D8Y857_DICVI|nr:hypothetical protein DICVIV_01469 [Dictyocaulus viviparus]